MSKLNVSETLKGAFADLRKHAFVLAAAGFLLTALVGAGAGLAAKGSMALAAATPSTGLAGAAYFGGGLVALGLWAFLYTGLLGIALKIQRRESVSITDLFGQGRRLMPAWIAVTVINVAIFAVPILLSGFDVVGVGVAFGGWAVFGWIAFVLTSLSLFFVIDRQQPALTAIGSSIRVTRRSLFPLMGIMLLAALAGSLFSLVPVIGSLASLCFQVLVVSRVYMQLKPGCTAP